MLVFATNHHPTTPQPPSETRHSYYALVTSTAIRWYVYIITICIVNDRCYAKIDDPLRSHITAMRFLNNRRIIDIFTPNRTLIIGTWV